MEDYPGIIKDWEKAMEKDSMSCPNCEALARKLAEAEGLLKELIKRGVQKIGESWYHCNLCCDGRSPCVNSHGNDCPVPQAQAFLATSSVPGWVVVKREDLEAILRWEKGDVGDQVLSRLQAALKEKP